MRCCKSSNPHPDYETGLTSRLRQPHNTRDATFTLLNCYNYFSGQTEIVENSSNPLFMKTIGLGNQGTPPKTKIKLCVYDVRELVSRTVS